MNDRSDRLNPVSSIPAVLIRGLGLALLLSLFSVGSLVQGADTKPLPAWNDINSYVDRHFENTPDFQPGDIISVSNVEPLLDGLDKMGWTVLNRKTLLNIVPKDSDFVVKQLRTKPGYLFMRQISKYPLCYDRLYHLAAIPRGRQQVYDLVRAKDGYKMIEYMTTTQQGKNLGTQLSHSPHGENFNKSTGLIYTEKELKVELEKSYAETLKLSQSAGQ